MTRMRGFTATPCGRCGSRADRAPARRGRRARTSPGRAAPTMRRKSAIEFTGWRLISRMIEPRSMPPSKATELSGSTRCTSTPVMPAGMSKRCALLSSISIRLQAELAGAGALRRSLGGRRDAIRPAARGRSASLTDTVMRAAVAHVLEPARCCRAARSAISRISRSCVRHRPAVDRRRSRRRAAGRRARPASPA